MMISVIDSGGQAVGQGRQLERLDLETTERRGNKERVKEGPGEGIEMRAFFFFFFSLFLVSLFSLFMVGRYG